MQYVNLLVGLGDICYPSRTMLIARNTKPGRRLAILGGGRVGRTLGYLWRESGYSIVAVICRKHSHARQAVRFIGDGRPANDPSMLSRVEWDSLLITTPDRSIASLAAALARYPIPWRTRAVLHCSGLLSFSELAPLADQGAATASLHPVQTFARPSQAIQTVRGSYFALEGSRRGLPIARRLVADLGGRPLVLPTTAKTLYHSAAFLASGHLCALAGLSISLLERAGIPEIHAKAMLHSLMATTIENIRRMPIGQAVTGPISRADRDTVKAHLECLEAISPKALAVYKRLGQIMVDMVQDVQISARQARILKRMLR